MNQSLFISARKLYTAKAVSAETDTALHVKGEFYMYKIPKYFVQSYNIILGNICQYLLWYFSPNGNLNVLSYIAGNQEHCRIPAIPLQPGKPSG